MSLNKCIGDLQNERRSKTEHYRTFKTNLLNLIENKLHCKRKCYERKKFFEIRRFEVCTGKMKGAQVQQVDEFSMENLRENHETLPSCSECKNRWSLRTVLEKSRILNQNLVEDCLAFPVNLKWFRVLLRCSAATKDCRFIHGKQSGVQENVFGNLFSTFDSPRDVPRISSDDVPRNREAAPGDPKVKTSLTSEDGQKYGTVPLPMFASRRWLRVLNIRLIFRRTTWSDSKDSKCRNCNSTGSVVHHHFWCGKQDSKHRSQVVLIFSRKVCSGSKKWRWLIHWMS